MDQDMATSSPGPEVQQQPEPRPAPGPLPAGEDDSKMDVDLESKTTTPPAQPPAPPPSHSPFRRPPDEEPMLSADNPASSSNVPSISYVKLKPVSIPEAPVSSTAESQPKIGSLPEAEPETGGMNTESESPLPTLPPQPLPPSESQELEPRLDQATPTSQSPPIAISEGPQGTVAQERPLNVTDALRTSMLSRSSSRTSRTCIIISWIL
ncbi:hypothetical protein PILCRDRAFT_715303 [Piloderma croceum F 1598]|uniref:Uncharacterized protein n=1 Tax=Piloderma croceum (strain F 1598) TaxID=765440 RepID=A0A0C3B9G0_PILCF|nr:hypothetical protein PILCRDRAFT_715303 [Piloderma croceum F 1598]